MSNRLLLLLFENRGATLDVSRRIQKARGAFIELRKVWQSTLMTRDTKITVFSASVKSVLLYGFETQLVTNELRWKIQTFINRFLTYILRIWWPRLIWNGELSKLSGQTDINMEIRTWKFRWTGHTLMTDDEGEGEDQETDGGYPVWEELEEVAESWGI
jgi:hypothetical protein